MYRSTLLQDDRLSLIIADWNLSGHTEIASAMPKAIAVRESIHRPMAKYQEILLFEIGGQHVISKVTLLERLNLKQIGTCVWKRMAQ
jgi:hypothetical protein